jgi:hypothetical protein
MPRYCKYCDEEFPTASKLAEHLKFNICSNQVPVIKCPYCDRDDFVDQDSLNRHLSHNRLCSRADVEATDKLSILAPDPYYISTRVQNAGKGSDQRLYKTTVSYVDVLPHFEGSLVNIANSMEMQARHQLHTSLRQDPNNLTLFVTLTEEGQLPDGGIVERQLKSVEKLISSQPVSIEILQNDNPAESEVAHTESFLNKPAITTAGTSEQNDNDGQGHNNYAEEPCRDVEEVIFDVDDDHETESQGSLSHTGVIPSTFEDAMKNLPIVKNFHGGSPQLDCLADLYSMLDKCGVANTLFDDIAQWAWLNGPSFGRIPPMKRKVVVDKVFRHVRGENYKQYMAPRQKILKLSTGRHVAVTFFPLENVIKDLLCNSTLMKADHLLLDDRNNVNNNSDQMDLSLGDVDTGSWWTTATETECIDSHDFLWPLIMFIDGMKVDNHSGKLKLEPISFTFSRFRRWIRNQDNAWRTWAYMEEVKQPRFSNTEEECGDVTAKERMQEYHDILHFLMNDLKKIQEEGFPWILDFGEGRKENVVLKMPLQFVIGDCKGMF